MLFHTQYFICFFLFIFCFHWSIKDQKGRHIFLLLSSYLFYMMWNVKLVSLLIISSILDFYLGKSVWKTGHKLYVFISLFINLSILGFFKYANFFIESFIDFSRLLGYDPSRTTLDIILPLGISFYTFQSMSYTIDMYRKKYKPYNSILDFALYVSFFPQLIAGPIVRANYFLKQINRKINLSFKLVNTGVSIFIIGCFKKIVIADQAAVFSNEIFSSPSEYTFLLSSVGILAFSFQIYFDFSGYTDMARGLGYLLGYKLPENFLHPYGSLGIREFWRRWHLSLSSWLKDYLYISLGGSRGTSLKTKFNLIITMLLGGLWHGASWNFVIWGAIHGLLLSLENYLNQKYNWMVNSKIFDVFLRMVTYVLVCFAWVFFRAETFNDAMLVFNALFTLPATNLFHQIEFFGLRNWIFGIFIPSFIILIGAINPINKNFNKNKYFGAIITVILLLIILVVGGGGNEFIYFQF